MANFLERWALSETIGWEGEALPRLSQEELLQRGRALSRAKLAGNIQVLIASKLEHLRYYDVPNMERVMAVCFWGRSGSLLVASYLDGHDNVVLLPTIRSQRIYEFFDSRRSLSLQDKLITYPIFSNDFFQGDFPIAAADYYAAVAAILEIYGGLPRQLLETSRAFFQFLHAAYNLALNRRPASPHPLMVYAQHWWNDALARRLVEDFPQARFLHCVRDPITAFDRTFEHWSKQNKEVSGWLLRHFTRSDHSHPGMESRSRAIRFEDLHTRTAETISRLADWLGLPDHAALLDSTFNGLSYTVERAHVSSSGARPDQTLRSSRNIAFTDRALLFALFYENFFAWNYSCPKIFAHSLVRGLTCLLLLPIPMKVEFIGACTLVNVQVFSCLRKGRFGAAFKAFLRLFWWRIAIMWYVASEICRRLFFKKTVLELL